MRSACFKRCVHQSSLAASSVQWLSRQPPPCRTRSIISSCVTLSTSSSCSQPSPSCSHILQTGWASTARCCCSSSTRSSSSRRSGSDAALQEPQWLGRCSITGSISCSSRSQAFVGPPSSVRRLGSALSTHSSRVQAGSSSFQELSSSSSNGGSASSTAPRPPPSGSEISSASNAYIKHCVKLRDNARYRQQQRRLLVAGATLLSELAAAAAAGGGLQAVTLFLKPGVTPPPGLSADSVITVTDVVMKKLTGLEESAGVTMAAELAMPPLVDLMGQQQQQHRGQLEPQQQGEHQQQQGGQQQLKLQRLLVLESVQDPGNLGTLLRCAAAFGWDAVWLLPGCCDPSNDKALRASRGAAFKVPLAAGSLEQLLQVVDSRGMVLLAAEPDPAAEETAGMSPTTSSSSNSSGGSSGSNGSGGFEGLPVALVLGSEGSGLSAEVLAVAQPLAVPMVGDMESLNVGVAGSILMFCLSEGWSKLTVRLQQLQLLP